MPSTTSRRSAERGAADWPLRAAIALAMLALFAASVWVRLPNMGRPLGEGHEWLTSTVARNLEIWERDGALKHRFLPIFTYPGAANRYINNQGSDHMDAQGNYYYTSYGPFAYIAPYLALKALGQPVTVIGIQRFNLAVHLATAVLLFLVVVEVTRPRRPVEYAPALFAYALYTFTTATLWLHSNVYMSDMFVQPLWVLCILLVFRYADAPGVGWRKPAAIAAAIALAVWTEWLGVFFAATLAGYAVAHWRRKAVRRLFAASIAGGIGGVALYVGHYSLIDGLAGLWKASYAKYAIRSGVSATSNFPIDNPISWQRIGWHYTGFGYGPVLLLAVALLCVIGFAAYRATDASSRPVGLARRARLALVLAAAPVLLHHLVFFDFTAVHFFSVLKAAVVLALAAGIGASCIIAWLQTRAPAHSATLFASALAVGMIAIAAAQVANYRSIAEETRFDAYERLGEIIATEAAPDETVFLRAGDFAGFEPWQGAMTGPQVVYYAHRNFASWSTTEAAYALMERQGTRKGMTVGLDPGTGNVRVQHFLRQ
ncbi:MAG: hypothetical protein N3B11_05180 [Coriobacteriia bacterium]|nr:hypothetical protein [Coriobacteriia bacterium]